MYRHDPELCTAWVEGVWLQFMSICNREDTQRLIHKRIKDHLIVKKIMPFISCVLLRCFYHHCVVRSIVIKWKFWCRRQAMSWTNDDLIPRCNLVSVVHIVRWMWCYRYRPPLSCVNLKTWLSWIASVPIKVGHMSARGISLYQRAPGHLLKSLFRLTTKTSSKVAVTGHVWRDSRVHRWIPCTKASNAENVSM